MSAPQGILDLIARFELQLDSYKSGSYNETQLRREFLDPFFKVLGWDIDNTAGYAEAYKDVIHEDAIRVGDQHKAPDYCFRIGGTRKFFLEAKKPAVYIKEEIPPAYQLRSYAWSAKLPLSILSDFEEFAIYDCRIKPKKEDSAAGARIFYCTFREYPEKWDEIASIFSREAVLKGSFDRFVDSTKAKKGTAEFDQDFLATIEGWRTDLAQNLALRNPNLTQRELNFAVQRIIDRIIFLRICEARGIEDYGRLRGLVNGDGIYPRLAKLFEMADARYNSGLFHFKKEPGRHEAPDELTLELRVDDKLLRDIIRGLYYPESPYHFSVVSADILGQVYEQFLGKVIRLTDGHRAVIEDKPEVKKAGGVYYTPTYVVDYIVQQTVGNLVKQCEISPTETGSPSPTTVRTRVSKLRILDPACGSGSFLIGAYQYLLDWHLQFYTANDPIKFAKSSKPAVVETTGGWKLTIAERKRILLNNIYGVDIDAQAVEVTKLSLLLKVLEGETSQSLQSLFTFFHERALPDLGDNIKCGNSLIGPDFYQQSELPLLTDEEKLRINVFDWQAEFLQIFEAGGFDAVIGNPPYGIPFSGSELEYLLVKLPTAKKFPDSYCMFMLQAMSLLGKDGLHSFIVPNTFCDLENCDAFRRVLLNDWSITMIWQSGWAFKDAIVDTVVFVAEKQKPTNAHVIEIQIGGKSYVRRATDFLQNELQKIDYRNTADDRALLSRLTGSCACLGDLAIVKAGVKMYEKGKGTPPQTRRTMEERPFSKSEVCPAGWKPLYRGEDVQRYQLAKPKEFVNYGPWLAAPRSPELFASPKILMRRTDDRLMACLETTSAICVNSCHVIKLCPDATSSVSSEYLLGILNSRLSQRVFEIQNPQMIGKVFAEIKVIYVERLLVRTLDFSNHSDKAAHHRMASLVNSMLGLHQKLAAAKTPQEKTALERELAATDARIDRLVYELYGLTEDEIKIVEGTAVANVPRSAEVTENSAVAEKPKRTSRKNAYAEPPPAPVNANLTPEKAYGDAAHYFSAKEEMLPYRTDSEEKDE